MSGQPSSAPLSPSSHHWRRVANPVMQVIPIHSLTSRLGVRATIDTIQRRVRRWASTSYAGLFSRFRRIEFDPPGAQSFKVFTMR